MGACLELNEAKIKLFFPEFRGSYFICDTLIQSFKLGKNLNKTGLQPVLEPVEQLLLDFKIAEEKTTNRQTGLVELSALHGPNLKK